MMRLLENYLYITSTSSINGRKRTVSAANVDSLISIIPYVQDEGGIENSAQSNFIVIYS
jgi:hypothetical protein